MNASTRFEAILQATEQRFRQQAQSRSAPVTATRILGANDLTGAFFLRQGAAAARAVARLHIRTAQGIRQGYGTGFLVSPRLLLTNNHVLRNAASAAHSWAEFHYETGRDGKMEPAVCFNLDPDRFFLTSPELDYTLVALRPDSRVAAYGWLPVSGEQGNPRVGEYVNIIQHPNGEPKQLALRENKVVAELEDYLHYRSDTAPGSSGSPVFNDQWEVVALHHSGVPKRDAQKRILTTDGRVWEKSMGELRIAWQANEGVRISRIIAHINGQVLTTTQRALRDEMLESLPPQEAETLASTATASWSIPLTITLEAGSMTPGLSIGGASPPPVAMPEPETDAELQDVLDDLAHAHERVYYDAVADELAATAYYQGIRTDVTPEEFFAQLSEQVRASHQQTFRYKPGVHVYPWVDLHPDLQIHSIYSGKAFDPGELIREDFRLARERSVRLQEFMLRESFADGVTLEQELDLLEASLPYNCEHVVPQSWFGKREPMRGDLHHLFACESGCNSFRSNIPYYDFPEFEEAVRDDCGKRTDEQFEPAHGKGAVARAALYFLLRYPGMIGDEAREMQRERLPILLDWHKKFPPDEYELHRNVAIYDMQGNRNPLIDHPEWADLIDFGQGMG